MSMLNLILKLLFSNWYVPLGLTIFAILYYLKGWDLIPDFFPLGKTDDFLFFGLAILSWFYYLGSTALPNLGSWFLNQKTSIQILIGAGIVILIVMFSSLNTNKVMKNVKSVPIPKRGAWKK